MVEQNTSLVDNEFVSKSYFVSKEITNQLKVENSEESKNVIAELNIYLFKISILGNIHSTIESQYKQVKQHRGALEKVFKGKSNEIYIVKLYEMFGERRCQFYNMGISIFREVLINRPISLYTVEVFEAIFKFMEKETMYDDIKPLLTKLQTGEVLPTLQMYKSICSNLYNNRTSKLIYSFFNLVKDTFKDELFTKGNWEKYTRDMYANSFVLDVEALPTNLFENFKVLLADTQNVEPLFFYNHPLVFKSIINAIRIMDKDQLAQIFQNILNNGNINQVYIRLFLEFLNEDVNIFDPSVQSKIPGVGKYIDIFEVAHDLVGLSGVTEVLEIQNCLLKYCLIKERFDRVETIFHHIGKFNEETLIIMFNIFEKTGNYIDANLLMRRAKTEEFQFTKEVVAAYFKAMIAAKRDCLDEFIQFTQVYTFVRLGDDVFKLIYHELNNIKKGLLKETDNKIKSILED
ncbi:predicted protein [Naegleria gruberi]|uniref:Predicted protein n=1 Tax=Naegleria gruberi TaxID=5762 RepID=D2W3Y3_NAEGR|nr:uncharacterized protein NAEGRDRAFT_76109 [Naegleria gruberi]EFC36217.1 predicted protein [Naegleria gruberi]|eukprot:XP_002668961.1 predicted protein [Naegleria gruberi strain NEG-M]